jgi:hypothetical protein
MTRHGSHRLSAQAYQLAPMIPLAVRSRNTAPLVKIRHNGTRLQCGINRQGRAFPVTATRQAPVSALRLRHRNPKSP